MGRSKFTKIFFRMLLCGTVLAAIANATFWSTRYFMGDPLPSAAQEWREVLIRGFFSPIVNAAFIATWTILFFPRRWFPLSLPIAAGLFFTLNRWLIGTPLLFCHDATIADFWGVILFAYIVLFVASMRDRYGPVKIFFRSDTWK